MDRDDLMHKLFYEISRAAGQLGAELASSNSAASADEQMFYRQIERVAARVLRNLKVPR